MIKSEKKECGQNLSTRPPENKICTICFFLIFMMLTGCVSATHNKNKIKIATAEKRLGEAYMAQGQHAAALKELLNAEKELPGDPFLQYDLGLVYLARKRFKQAEIRFRKAIAMKEDYSVAKNSLGVVLMRQGKWDQAIVQFTEVLEDLLYATLHYPVSNMGWVYLEKRDYKNAELYFKKALEIQPDFINAIHGLASTYTQWGKFSQSFSILKRAISKHPTTAILHADLAVVQTKTGNNAAARRSWNQVIQLKPGSELVTKAERHLDDL